MVDNSCTFDTVRYGTVRYDTVRYGTVWFRASSSLSLFARHGSVQFKLPIELLGTHLGTLRLHLRALANAAADVLVLPLLAKAHALPERVPSKAEKRVVEIVIPLCGAQHTAGRGEPSLLCCRGPRLGRRLYLLRRC